MNGSPRRMEQAVTPSDLKAGIERVEMNVVGLEGKNECRNLGSW